jgi:hypothetical protein
MKTRITQAVNKHDPTIIKQDDLRSIENLTCPHCQKGKLFFQGLDKGIGQRRIVWFACSECLQPFLYVKRDRTLIWKETDDFMELIFEGKKVKVEFT